MIKKNGEVKIINYTQNPDAICSASARISTTLGSANEIYESSLEAGESRNQSLIDKVLLSGHLSIVEHIHFNISFSDVSAFVEQFMIEFRLASFTIKSRRYVDFRNMGYYIPDSFLDDKSSCFLEQYMEHMQYLFDEYQCFVDQGIPKEDARFVLPYSYRSNFYCSVNARELYHIIESMLNGRGMNYKEIRDIGESLLHQAQVVCPAVFSSNSFCSNKNDANKQEKVANLLSGYQKFPMTNFNSVELIYSTNNPEKVITSIAIMNSLPANKSIEDYCIDDVDLQNKIINVVMADKRKRELEYANFTFRINEITLAGITHIARHRMQSLIVPNFCDVFNFNSYVVPSSIQSRGYEKRYKRAFSSTGKLVEKFLSNGLSRYDVVYLLLSGLKLSVTTTMNARELEVFIGLRTCNRSQWEIRDIATEMLDILRCQSPVLFNKYGPKCFMKGYCSEGKMTCGKLDEIAKAYTTRKKNKLYAMTTL